MPCPCSRRRVGATGWACMVCCAAHALSPGRLASRACSASGRSPPSVRPPHASPALRRAQPTADFLKSRNFRTWLKRRQARAARFLARLYLEAVVEYDLEAWAKERCEAVPVRRLEPPPAGPNSHLLISPRSCHAGRTWRWWTSCSALRKRSALPSATTTTRTFCSKRGERRPASRRSCPRISAFRSASERRGAARRTMFINERK